MKAGETALISVDLGLEIVNVGSIIFTMQSVTGLVQKKYPTDVTYVDGKFKIPLTQDDTIALKGHFALEAQVNYANVSVVKSNLYKGFVASTLATEIITGNTPDGQETEVALTIDSIVVNAGGGENGATFTPSVSADGVVSWTNDKDLPNPTPINIKGNPGTDGTTPHIGDNGNWYIGDIDTGVLAGGGGTADLSNLALSISGTSLQLKNGTEDLGLPQTIPTASQEDINAGVLAYMTEHPVSADVGDGSITITKLSSEVVGDISKTNTFYDYTTAVTPQTTYGNMMMFLTSLSIPSGRKIKLTLTSAAIGTSYIKLYSLANGTLTRYHNQAVNFVVGQNVIDITCVTQADTYIAIDDISARLFNYDKAPTTVYGFKAASHASYTDDSSFVYASLSTYANYNILAKVELTKSAIAYAEDLDAQIESMKSLYGGGNNVLFVGLGERFTYHTLLSAESAAVSGDTIVVFPGTYTEHSIGSTKKLNWIGVNKYTCIVTNGYAEKSKSPFNLYGGSTLNGFTIIETHESPTSLEESVAYKAYCVHMDSDNMANTTTLVENCIMKDRYMACLGIGLCQNSHVIIKDCDMYVYDINPNTTIRTNGALYCHGNSVAGITGQKISVINCFCHSTISNAMRIDAVSSTGSEMKIECINTTCVSDELGITSVVGLTTTTQTTITNTSHGNNASAINYLHITDGNEVSY